MSPEYAAALETARLAAKKFREVQDAYRAKRCDDAAFLAARREYDASEIAFTAAHNAERERGC